MDKDCLRLCFIWGLKQHTHIGENNTNRCSMLWHRGGRINLDINNIDTNIGFDIGLIRAFQFQPLRHSIVASLPHFIKEHTRLWKHRPFHMRHTLRLLLSGTAPLAFCHMTQRGGQQQSERRVSQVCNAIIQSWWRDSGAAWSYFNLNNWKYWSVPDKSTWAGFISEKKYQYRYKYRW